LRGERARSPSYFRNGSGLLNALGLLVLSDHSLELTHGSHIGRLDTGETLSRSRDGLGANSLDRLLISTRLTAGSVLSDLGSNTSDVGLLDRFAFDLEAGLVDNLRLDGFTGVSLGGGTLIELKEIVRVEDGGLGLLETEVGEVIAVGELDNTLGDVALTRELGDIRKGLRLERVLNRGGLGGVNVLVDEGLHLVVSVEVVRVTVKRDLVTGGVVDLERVHDKLELNTSVGGEDVLRLDASKLEGPVGDEDDSRSEVGHVNVRVLRLELVDGLLGEVARNVEEIIGDKEVRRGLLDEALEGGLLNLLGDLGEVATALEDKRVEILERGSAAAGHFC